MSIVIVSPVRRWPGTVTLYDTLTFPQYFAVKEAIERVDELRANANGRQLDITELHREWVPAICKCVQQWELVNFPVPVSVETFPAAPLRSAVPLTDWLIRELTQAVLGEEEVPNG